MSPDGREQACWNSPRPFECEVGAAGHSAMTIGGQCSTQTEVPDVLVQCLPAPLQPASLSFWRVQCHVIYSFFSADSEANKLLRENLEVPSLLPAVRTRPRDGVELVRKNACRWLTSWNIYHEREAAPSGRLREEYVVGFIAHRRL